MTVDRPGKHLRRRERIRRDTALILAADVAIDQMAH
jgi:hypothetical protein